MEDGTVVRGETRLRHQTRHQVMRLEPEQCLPLPDRWPLFALLMYYRCPGELYTSILPNLRVGRVAQSIGDDRQRRSSSATS